MNQLSLTRIGIVYRRELQSYFVTPLAYIFIAVFLLLSGFLTFELGSFFAREQADLLSFFLFHPWLYLVLVPPLSMRLWAEERRSGNLELLMTLPLSLYDSVMGKFLAAWTFTGIALLLSFPLWLTVNYLGDPDNGIIAAAYCGSWLMSGAFLAVGSCLSAATKNQVIAYVLTVMMCLLFILAGLPMLQDVLQAVLPEVLAQGIANLSLLTHFQSISRGVLDIRDLLFFILFALCWLGATVVVLNLKKAE